MDMPHFKNLHVLAPGVFSNDLSCITTNKTDNTVTVTVVPEKNTLTNVYFILNSAAVEKNYIIDVSFHHQHATVQIFGLYALSEKQVVEIKSTMNHFVPHCNSNQLWKGILNDSAKAAFDGKIVVAKDAQKTSAQLSNKNLLLSARAEVNTKPALEIYADDVKCSHGATVGFLDHSALFYLRSRGILEEEARKMLVKAFADEILNNLGEGV